MSLPSNLQFFLNRLSGYARNTYRISTVNNDNAVASGFVTVDMPSNALLDLSTFSWHFKGSTTTTGTQGSTNTCAFPRHIESIIDSLSVEVNGQLISSIPTQYNQVWNMLADTTLGTDAMKRRQILQNSAPVAAVAANETNRPFCIQNWLGFLGSVQPQCIDSGALGSIRVRIGLAPSSILVSSSTPATGPSYSLSDMFFTIDCLSIDDGSFHASYANYLAGGGVLEMPYTDLYSFSAGNVQSAGTVRFSLSTQSLDMVMCSFVETNTPNVLNPDSGTSTFFRRNIGANNSALQYQYNINNVFSPTLRISGDQAFAQLCTALNVAQDTLGGMTPELDTLAKWRSSFWVAAYRFCHDADSDARLVSGVDSRGSVSQCFLEYSGLDVTTPKLAILFAFGKSVLRVGGGRLIEKVA